jgi:hypothetical protein
VKAASQIGIFFVFGICLCFGQRVDLSGYELDQSSKYLIPVLHEDLTGFVRCGDVKLRVRDTSRTAFPDSPKRLNIASGGNGGFRFAHVADGDWKLVGRSRCDGRARHTQRVIRIKPIGFSDCLAFQIIVDLREGRTEVQRHETDPCF